MPSSFHIHERRASDAIRMCLKCKDFYWFILCRLFRESSCPVASPLHDITFARMNSSHTIHIRRTHTHTLTRFSPLSSPTMISIFPSRIIIFHVKDTKHHSFLDRSNGLFARHPRSTHSGNKSEWNTRFHIVEYASSHHTLIQMHANIRWIGLKSANDGRSRWRWRCQMARKLISLIHVKFSYTFFDFVSRIFFFFSPSLSFSWAWSCVLDEYIGWFAGRIAGRIACVAYIDEWGVSCAGCLASSLPRARLSV